MKKKNIIRIIILFSLFTIFFVIFKIKEDTWICQNGEWVKHGNPIVIKPNRRCSIKEKFFNNKKDEENVVENKDLILNNIKENDLLIKDFIIEGKIKGGFFFEGSFPIQIEDNNKNVLGLFLAKSTTDWMTSDYVEFKTDPANFDKKDNTEGYMVFKKDNPSGLPENDKEIRLKMKF